MNNLENKIAQVSKEQYVKLSKSDEIPKQSYVVYILTFNNEPIVLGHGRKNRAKVIFDNLTSSTSGHIKAIIVRLYHLFNHGEFERYIIPCKDKQHALDLEKELHLHVGGNTLHIPDNIKKQLFQDIDINSTEYLLLQLALNSSYDGLSDLKKWRRLGLIQNNNWKVISDKFKL